jgi:hypothetical protein
MADELNTNPNIQLAIFPVIFQMPSLCAHNQHNSVSPNFEPIGDFGAPCSSVSPNFEPIGDFGAPHNTVSPNFEPIGVFEAPCNSVSPNFEPIGFHATQ